MLDFLKGGLARWMLGATVVCAVLPHFIGPAAAFAVAAIVGVILVCSVLVSQGLKAMDALDAEEDYFTAASLMSSTSTHDAIGATWIMLGNVIVANMFIAQSFGVVAIWILATWLWAFFLLSRHLKTIRTNVLQGETLHGFIRRIYDSRKMQLVAATVTVAVGIGVFAIELLMGLALLIPFFPAPQISTTAPVLIIVVVIGMCAAVMTGGLRSIISSDSRMWYAILIGVTSLLVVVGTAAVQERGSSVLLQISYLPPGLGRWEIAVFMIGVFVLQVPLLLCDYGTWQRIRATKFNESERLARKVFQLGFLQAYVWGLPIVAGLLVILLPPLDQHASGYIYEASSPLIESIRHWLSLETIPSSVRAGACVIIVMGLLAVLVSTADGYLLVALEATVRDFFPNDGESPTTRARVLAVPFALLGCVPVIGLVYTGGNLLGIIATFFGAQVALAPAAVLALYEPSRAREWSNPVAISTLTGFLATLFAGAFLTYVPFEGEWSAWLATYGVYAAPVPALLIPLCVISAMYFRASDIRSWLRFLSWMFLPERSQFFGMRAAREEV